MSSFARNIQAYFKRINFVFDANASKFETLSKMQLCHMSQCPFENLDVVNQKIISMNSIDVEAKIVGKRRGGYCFEQNILFQEGLRSLGFAVKPVLARVRWNRPKHVDTTFTHVILIVDVKDNNVDDQYLVDVGFGGIGSNAPIQINTEAPQQTDGLYRIASVEDNYLMLQWYLHENWVDMYKFRNEVALDCDMQCSNWWSCTHPGAKWKNCLFVAIVKNDIERHYILNSYYCIKNMTTGVTLKTKIESVDSLFDILQSVFGINIEDIASSEEERKILASNCEVFLNIDANISTYIDSSV
jgi:N-hydroxyarylamine O-acetyltransferase